ncbi:MAG: amidohydrolase [Kordiimonadaceae bacterium]|nr:amidohydrolase [Kordiimonadaceae bacterium]MBT6328276.1 amidohydrolase [Kordiimonadaceae bacterium]MBT7583719.1 amidohydrolase [Kordiimonadaceae bacterium]
MNNFLKIIMTIGLLMITSCSSPEPEITEPGKTASKIITNANVWTGNEAQPWAEVVVMDGERIIAVGGAELNTEYSGAEMIDAGGKLVLPGFIDNHTHFMDGAATLLSIKTFGSTSREDFVGRIRDYAQDIPAGEWISGGSWDHELWGGELPHKDWIDDITGDNPLFLLRTDMHMAIANSATLKLAGVTKDTPDVEGGLIVRDENGEPTGVLKDNAMNYVWKIFPELTTEQADRTFDAGITEALENGVTQVHSMGGFSSLDYFKKAKAEGRLKIRAYYLPHISYRHQLAELIEKEGKGDNWLRLGGVKELVDGSLGSTTAWFYEPYADEPDTNGFPLMQMDELKKSLEEAHAYGFQLAIHGIGDQTNDEILKLFEEIGAAGHRPRIEHAQHLTPSAIQKFAELGAVPSVQPYHAIDDGRWAEKRIGVERLSGTYPFKSLVDAGAMMTFGSDWSVGPLEPLSGIYAAVTRRTTDGANPDGWVPEQKISVEDAVKAYTYNNAWAGNQEDILGTIEPGKLADIVIISDNIFEIAPEEIINTKVMMTIVGGDVKYSISN